MLEPKLFLSYARGDAEAAAILHRRLTAEGYSVRQDTEELLAGDSFESHIRRTLQTCDGYVVLITPRSLVSTWVLVELGGAWVGGLRIFPVVADIKYEELPGPVRRLSCCSIEEVDSKLLPALAKLRASVQESAIALPSEEDLQKIAADAVSSHVAISHSAAVTQLVTEALSVERDRRRMAHTAVQQGPENVRKGFLQTMLALTRHANSRLRGEAFYCLGQVSLRENSYFRSERFFRKGLADESDFVKACCANILRNFAPLEAPTIDRLTDLLGANVFRAQTNKAAASIVYYSSMTLDRDRSIRQEGGRRAP